MPNTMNFAARLILKESARKLTEEVEDLLNDEEVEKEKVEEEPLEDEVEVQEVESETDEFEESIDDKIFFCANCNKHFIASEDTPEDLVHCPICNEKDLIVSIGSAEQALENPENEEVSKEIEEVEEDTPEEELTDVEVENEEETEEDSLELDDDGLAESLQVLASKYSGLKECKVKIVKAYMKENNIVVNGRLNGKPFGMVLEGFDPKKKKMVLEGKCNMLKNCVVKIAALREGNSLKVNKMGYGLLHESRKVRGIIK